MVSVDGLTVEFSGTTLFKDISFVINDKDRIALMGKNGAGKSTMLKILAGVKTPNRGKVTVTDGGKIGYLPQQTLIQKDFPASVREIVLSGLLGKCGLRPFYTREQKALAKKQMSFYQDVKTEGGTETGMLMGDFFLNMPEDNKVVQVFMEGNSLITSNLVSLLAIGISGASGTTLSTRIAEKYEIKDTLSDLDYHDDASTLAKSFETIKTKLLRYDALKGEYNLEDEDMTEEEYAFLAEYATVADLLTTITYGDKTLAEELAVLNKIKAALEAAGAKIEVK